MTANGESPTSVTREAISLTGGRQTRYNAKTTPALDITKSNLMIWNWMERLVFWQRNVKVTALT